MLNFFHTKKDRDARCQDKNRVVFNLLKDHPIESPLDFKALLMPGLFGPEISILKDRGVPYRNMWALEKDPKVFARFIKMYPEIRTPCRAMPSSQAIDDIYLEEKKFNLVYLDFYGVANFEVRKVLQKIFAFKMLSFPSLLMVTTGKMRCSSFIKKFNDELRENSGREGINSIYIKCLLTNDYSISKIMDYPYYSLNTKLGRKFTYVTTAAYF